MRISLKELKRAAAKANAGLTTCKKRSLTELSEDIAVLVAEARTCPSPLLWVFPLYVEAPGKWAKHFREEVARRTKLSDEDRIAIALVDRLVPLPLT